jgi:hypothetical protein
MPSNWLETSTRVMKMIQRKETDDYGDMNIEIPQFFDKYIVDTNKQSIKSTSNSPTSTTTKIVNSNMNSQNKLSDMPNSYWIEKGKVLTRMTSLPSNSSVINKLQSSPFFGDADGNQELKKILRKSKPINVIKPKQRVKNNAPLKDTTKSKNKSGFSGDNKKDDSRKSSNNIPTKVSNTGSASTADNKSNVSITEKQVVVAERLFKDIVRADGNEKEPKDTSAATSAIDKLTYAERLQVMILQVQDAANAIS